MNKFATLLLFILPFASQVLGHERGEHYIFLEFHDDHIEGRVEFLTKELPEKVGVDVYEDGKPSLEKLEATSSVAHEYILSHVSIGPDATTNYSMRFSTPSFFSLEGGWSQYNFRIDTDSIPHYLTITDKMGYENDAFHRGVVVIEKGDWPAKGYSMIISMVFSKSNPTQILDVRNPPTVMGPIDMIWQGVLHIWIGIDHILFLLSLALPVVLIQQNKKWEPAPSLGRSLGALLKIVTIFTIAHSITLLLAGLDLISVSSRLVESIIALSIVLVALNNIFGKSHRTSLWVILVLGLFHGLGFATVMGDLPFRVAEFKPFLLSVIGFNFGVELGQLAILLVVFPALFALRKAKFYSPLVLTGGSAALITIAGYWFVQRAFGL